MLTENAVLLEGMVSQLEVRLGHYDLLFASVGSAPEFDEKGDLTPGVAEIDDLTYSSLHVYRFRLEFDEAIDIQMDGERDIFFTLIRDDEEGMEVVAIADQDFDSVQGEFRDLSFFDGNLTAGNYIIIVQSFAEVDRYRLMVMVGENAAPGVERDSISS